MRLDKESMLAQLTGLLTEQPCAVGWNSDFERWDLKLRRGALGEARLRMVVEHHGGPRRRARFSAVIRPSRTVAWAVGVAGALAAGTAEFGLVAPAIAFTALLGLLWVAPIREANRLERGLRAATDELCREAVSEPGEGA
jgi:hypothetical protein